MESSATFEASGGGSTGTQKQNLQVLSLAHNAFSVVPRSLSCLAPQLTRLNLSYNKLTKMGHLSSFPASLKQLDLSHNQIDSWFMEVASDNICYSEQLDSRALSRSMSRMSVASTPKMSKLLSSGSNNGSACPHKKHCRLDNLRTLIVSDNRLDSIKIHHSSTNRILFPVLSMLDLSNNVIETLPSAVSELTHLSVLNISGNSKISNLPAPMGRLSKLWNLNTRGCSLQEPLATMMSSKAYKTSDVIGYLRSILEHSKPYARLKLMVVGIQGIGKTSLLGEPFLLCHRHGSYFYHHFQERIARIIFLNPKFLHFSNSDPITNFFSQSNTILASI